MKYISFKRDKNNTFSVNRRINHVRYCLNSTYNTYVRH